MNISHKECAIFIKAKQLLVFAPLVLLLLGGCSTTKPFTSNHSQLPQWESASEIHRDLTALPKPKGKIKVSLYGFRDQTGQFKSSPASTFSTTVTQGAASLLVKSLRESGWFIPLEREGLQNLLTERKIIRAANKDSDNALPQLMGASILLEGGIISYDTNIRTGGAGAKYFGVGAFEQYREDQISVNIRIVNVNTGEILNSVTTTKTLLSREMNTGAFRYIKFKRLFEAEMGYSENEPAFLCLQDAIDTAIIRLIITGIEQNHWSLENFYDASHPILQQYGGAFSRVKNKNDEPLANLRPK